MVVWEVELMAIGARRGFCWGLEGFFLSRFFFIIPGNDISLWGGSGRITERALRVIGRSTFFSSELSSERVALLVG